jgi:acetyltransferase-like isoleucine patch superfamily enzyme
VKINLKALIKNVMKLTGINVLFKKIVQIGLNEIIRKEPRYFSKLHNTLVQSKVAEIKKELFSVGSGIRINGDIMITHPRAMVIGNNVHIDNNAYFYSRAGVTIGDNTHISSNLTLYTASHQYQGQCLPYDSSFIDKPVVIGANVWIGMNVNILPGVTIGDGAIIGMGATISQNVPKGAIVASSEQRIVRYRDESHYNLLVDKNAIGGANGIKLATEHKNAYHKTAAELGENVFFVLSTGRAGSTTIARVLSQHSEIECLHEPKLSLVRLSTDYLHGKISTEQVEQELKSLYLESGIISTAIFGESDQKLSNLVSIIHKILPKAKFIWLIREPKQTINSTFSRGWFSDGELGFNGADKVNDRLYRGIFSDYRPHADLANQMTSDQWRTISAFERNCWYWVFWNGIIKSELGKIAPEQWLKVKLETIDEQTNDILNFLGTKNQDLAVFSTNGAEKKYVLTTESGWDEEMIMSYKKWCHGTDLY